MKEERKKYNANDLGYYNGGVPQPHRGAKRGAATGITSEFHHPSHHNFLNNYHPDSKEVTSEDSIKFKNFMQSDKVPLTMTRPLNVTYYDTDLNFSKDRRFWGALLCFMFAVTVGTRKFKIESDRHRRWERTENIRDLPAHHYENHGGVLLKKQFVGFEKYYKNHTDMMAWYKKAYPAAFQ